MDRTGFHIPVIVKVVFPGIGAPIKGQGGPVKGMAVGIPIIRVIIPGNCKIEGLLPLLPEHLPTYGIRIPIYRIQGQGKAAIGLYRHSRCSPVLDHVYRDGIYTKLGLGGLPGSGEFADQERTVFGECVGVIILITRKSQGNQ